MFNLNDIKLLTQLLATNIAETQSIMNGSIIDEAKHLCLENRLIVLVDLKRKLVMKLEQKLQCELLKPKQRLVLIIDDPESIRQVVCCYFIELGFITVDLAADGLEAWCNCSWKKVMPMILSFPIGICRKCPGLSYSITLGKTSRWAVRPYIYSQP